VPEMTDAELDEAFADLSDSEQHDIWEAAVDHLLDSTNYLAAPDWVRCRMITAQIRSTMRERLKNDN
jgi:hypothetical protein